MADIFAIVGNVVGGAARQAELKAQSRDEKLQARQEKIQGEADALEISKAANEALASNIARTFGAGGRVVSGESSGAAIKQVLSESSFARRVAIRGGQQREAQRKSAAAGLRTSANLAFITGVFAGAQSFGNTRSQTSNRQQPRVRSSGTATPRQRGGKA